MASTRRKSLPGLGWDSLLNRLNINCKTASSDGSGPDPNSRWNHVGELVSSMRAAGSFSSTSGTACWHEGNWCTEEHAKNDCHTCLLSAPSYVSTTDIAELISQARCANEAARPLLASCSLEQIAHVAHLGIGACCSVDLVAIHVNDGSCVLAAAKSCCLALNDSNQEELVREAETMARFSDCPFIMQLFQVITTQNLPEALLGGAECSNAPDLYSESCQQPDMLSLPHASSHLESPRTSWHLESLRGGGSMGTPALPPHMREGLSGRMLSSRCSMDATTGLGTYTQDCSTFGGCTAAIANNRRGRWRLPPDQPSVTTVMLLSWARGGDMKGIIKYLLHHPHLQHAPHGGSRRCVGRHLHDQLVMSEQALRFYSGCLLVALAHVHQQCMVHRDLKLANLLVLDSGYMQIGDLGTVADLSITGGRITGRVGSPGYMAPEVMWRDPSGYDLSADMWSVGACIFNMATGCLPAGNTGPPDRSWQPHLTDLMSPELRDLLVRLLAVSPSQRPTVQGAMHDPWFSGFDWAALQAMRMPAPHDVPWRELQWKPKPYHERVMV